jgi:hypothetical protein
MSSHAGGCAAIRNETLIVLVGVSLTRGIWAAGIVRSMVCLVAWDPGCGGAMDQMAVFRTVRASDPLLLQTGSDIERHDHLHFGPWHSRVFVGDLIAYAIEFDASPASTTSPALRTQTRTV